MVAISIGVALILGFLLGFIPEQRKNSTATSERDTAQSQLVTVQKEADLSSFKVRAAMTYIQAEKKNFSNASSSASSFFTDLQAYAAQTSDSGLKQQLESVLSQRDSIISGLAKADPAVTEQLQNLFLKMQSIQPTGDPGE
jgi:hypothetical protein